MLSVDRTTEAGEAPQRQRNFSVRARNEINDRAYLADREGKGENGRLGKKHLSAFAQAQFCDALAEQRRRSAHHSGNARARRYCNDPGLHPCRSTAIEGCASTISSALVIGRKVRQD